MTELADKPITKFLTTSLRDVLELETLEPDVFRAPPTTLNDDRSIFGGHIAALALRAAVHTVPEGRIVHSLHGYFLRVGLSSSPTVLRVDRDRDGGMFSARRVVVSQGGKVIFILSASFQNPQDGSDFQSSGMPNADDPARLPSFALDPRLLDIDARIPEDPEGFHRWPTRLWLRVMGDLPTDPNAHACALTFMSDICTGLSKAPAVEDVGLMPSLDHALWLHRQVNVNDWVLLDLLPEATAGGRGMYTGRIYGRDGTLIATLAQEALFRNRAPQPGLPA